MYERGRLKFRVGQIVYVAFSLDETVMGFGFPKEKRAALVASEPHEFQMPSTLGAWSSPRRSLAPTTSPIRTRRHDVAYFRTSLYGNEKGPTEKIGRASDLRARYWD